MSTVIVAVDNVNVDLFDQVMFCQIFNLILFPFSF